MIFADLAHLVERNLAKVEVAGSIPVIRSKKFRKQMLSEFFYPSRRLDDIQCFALMIYRRQAADDIHAFGAIFIKKILTAFI